MKLFKKEYFPNGKIDVFCFGKKVFSYKNWKRYDLLYGIKNYNNLKCQHYYDVSNTQDPKITLIYPVYYSDSRGY